MPYPDPLVPPVDLPVCCVTATAGGDAQCHTCDLLWRVALGTLGLLGLIPPTPCSGLWPVPKRFRAQTPCSVSRGGTDPPIPFMLPGSHRSGWASFWVKPHPHLTTSTTPPAALRFLLGTSFITCREFLFLALLLETDLKLLVPDMALQA